MLHHYTSIETLALILQSNAIRFNRLDRVDDVEESESFGSRNLASFFFVSCWTDADEESVPLWNMYTKDMRGVRISFPEAPFYFRRISSDNSFGISVQGEVEAPLTLEQQFTDKYFVVPTYLSRDKFARKVEYVNDVAGIYRDAVSFIPDDNGTFSVTVRDVHDIAVHKNRRWDFQSEYRFCLFVLPTPTHAASFAKDHQSFVNHFATCLYKGIGAGPNHIDVDLDPGRLKTMQVTLGPQASKAEEIIVKALLKEYVGRQNVARSVLSGKIRAR